MEQVEKGYQHSLEDIKGKTIGIVYGFDHEEAKGYEHYDLWKSDVISDWLIAVDELGCSPFLMDVRSFVLKAMNSSLPKIDYIVNLSNGTNKLSSLGLVPSTSSFLDIPCIPCDASVALLGENKKSSNYIARNSNVNVPIDMDENNKGGIYRPLNLGSSKGVSREKGDYSEYLYQEFIRGYDITTPIMYNPLLDELEVLPGIVYYPDNEDPDWFLGEQAKELHRGYKKVSVNLCHEIKDSYKELAKMFSIKTYCRIDARIQADSIVDLQEKIRNGVGINNIFFSEINPMPTIKKNINFHSSLDCLDSSYKMFVCLKTYYDTVQSGTLTGFILANAILAYVKAMH